MSKGPGRVERAIGEAFTSNPDGYFSVTDLATLVYPDRPCDRAQRVAIIRAADKVAPRIHWVWFRSDNRGGEIIYANGLSLRSYALGSIRAWLGGKGGYRWSYDDNRKLIRSPWMNNADRIADRLDNPGEREAEKAAPGVPWWLHVEYHKAIASGDTARAQEMQAQIDEIRRHIGWAIGLP